MKLSVIIPTHNRGKQLKQGIGSVLKIINESDCELIVVDNNSSDGTRKIIKGYKNTRYVFENSTSFSKARNTGATMAKGKILLYLDDDVIIQKGSLISTIQVFEKYKDCGVIAGRILPKFIRKPPKWTLECQKSFNGWSLYNSDQIPDLKDDIQEVTWAAGPAMAIRHDLFNQIGGFPPDTVGVETNNTEGLFEKLYIGPGDYGVCYMIRKIGFKLYYSSKLSVFHIISPIRLSISFWRSRIIGEGQHEAITQRGMYHLNVIKALKKRIMFKNKLKDYQRRYLYQLSALKNQIGKDKLLPEELWILYYKAYLDMDRILRKYPKLWKYLWKIGADGVENQNYNSVVRALPEEYLSLLSKKYI